MERFHREGFPGSGRVFHARHARGLHYPRAPVRSATIRRGRIHCVGDRHGLAHYPDAAAVTENDAAVAQEMGIRTTLKEELSRLMENAVAPEDIADGISLFDVDEEGSESLGLDSLDALELVMSIEQHYGVTVPTDVDFKELPTVKDIVGPNGGPPDGVIDLPNDILGVIQHQGSAPGPPYDVQYDRGPATGAISWNGTGSPDGVIDLPNDTLGVIAQNNHSCS